MLKGLIKQFTKMTFRPTTMFKPNLMISNQFREKVSTVYIKKMKAQTNGKKYKLKTKSSVNKRFR
jgi:hypothetical protein